MPDSPDTFAAGPVELARVTARIDAPVARVWAVLTDFAHPQRLAPTIDRCTTTGSGVGAVRIVHSSRGLDIHERLLECDAVSRRFRYEILDTGDMPFADVASYECLVILTDEGGVATRIDWRSEGRIDGPIAPINAFLDWLYRGASDNIAALLRAGEPVI